MIGRIFLDILRRLREALTESRATQQAIGSLRHKQERESLSRLAESVGLRPTPIQAPIPQRRESEREDDLQLVTEVVRESAEAQKENAQRIAEASRQRFSPRFLGVGTRAVVKQISMGPARGAIAAEAAMPQAAGAAIWPVLRVLGLIAGVGFLVVKALQGLGGAAERAALKLRGVLDQFADVSPAIAGMRAVMELYQRRDRLAVAQALAPQLRRELVSYRELLENTRFIRIAFAEIASRFRTFVNNILASIAKILEHLRRLFPGEKGEEKAAAPRELWPIVEALRQLARGDNLPDWRPVGPPPRFRGPRAQ